MFIKLNGTPLHIFGAGFADAPPANIVESVNSGVGVIVDNTNAANPIVNYDLNEKLSPIAIEWGSAGALTPTGGLEGIGRAVIYPRTVGAVETTLQISTADIILYTPARPWHFSVKDQGGNASTNNIVIAPESGFIDGQTSISITVDYGAVMIYCNGTDLFTL